MVLYQRGLENNSHETKYFAGCSFVAELLQQFGQSKVTADREISNNSITWFLSGSEEVKSVLKPLLCSRLLVLKLGIMKV